MFFVDASPTINPIFTIRKIRCKSFFCIFISVSHFFQNPVLSAIMQPNATLRLRAKNVINFTITKFAYSETPGTLNKQCCLSTRIDLPFLCQRASLIGEYNCYCKKHFTSPIKGIFHSIH